MFGLLIISRFDIFNNSRSHFRYYSAVILEACISLCYYFCIGKEMQNNTIPDIFGRKETPIANSGIGTK